MTQASAGGRKRRTRLAARADAPVQATAEQRMLGLRSLGITGGSEPVPAFAEGVRASGVGFYPILALSLLTVLEGFQAMGLFLLAPDLERTIAAGVGRGPQIWSFQTDLQLFAAVAGAAATAALVHRTGRPIRGQAAWVTALVCAAGLVVTAFVVYDHWWLIGVLLVGGLCAGAAHSVQPPLLLESYPPGLRVRAFCGYTAALAGGTALAALIVASTIELDLTWRSAVLVMGVVGIVVALVARHVRDRGFGVMDVASIEDGVRQVYGGGTTVAELSDDDVAVGVFESFRLVLSVPAVRVALLLFGLFGFFAVAVQRYLAFYFEQRWGIGDAGRATLFAVLSLCVVPALAWFGPRGEAQFQASPERLLAITSRGVAIGFVCVYLAVLSPVFVGMVLLLAVAYVGLYLALPSASVSLLTVVHPTRRTHASALAGMAMALGGVSGPLILSSFQTRFGTSLAFLVAAILGAGIALRIPKRAQTLGANVDQLVEEIIERETVRSLVSSGHHFPLLGCRHIDFSYGQVQVLFDVNLTVDEGQMVALLGTNGAGKSTLLRVISGLGVPSRGSVHFRGGDITYLSPSHRVELGVCQIPGGRAVFPPMSVVENLRVFGYTLGQDRRAVERGIESAFESFPALAARRNHLAATLSGGEQQMLALGKAFILTPRLLLIDELSLGLAPIVVGELLEIVRRINAAGTAVLLVEQSVNIALSLVDHAYFMEKGEIRFDGRAEELIRRPDLLRAVFLEGASKGGRR
jgi:ABC-type branched-subunit amino acid transport system ATPase component